MTPPIKVNRASFNRAKNRVAHAAEQVGEVKTQLEQTYFGSRPTMGESLDLEVTDERYEAMVSDIRTLQVAMDDFADRMLKIRRLYRKAQENAIVRARQIPK